MRRIYKYIIKHIHSDSRKFIGVDLGHPLRETTGICIYDEGSRRFYTFTTIPTCVITICEILQNITCVAIDAPLSLPNRGIERELERKCRSAGLRLIPPLLGAMRRLTICGICIREVLERIGIEVIETHPTSALKISNIGKDEIITILKSRIRGKLGKHEIDALICCLVAISYIENMYVDIGVERDRLILFTDLFVRKWLRKE